jgi:putative sterol carrier protein
MREIIAKFLVDGASYQPLAGEADKSDSKPLQAQPKAPVQEPGREQKPDGATIQKKQEAKKEEGKMASPQTAADIVRSLCDRFRPEKAGDYSTVFHFDLSGEGGGQFTFTIENGSCRVEPGLQGQAKCVVQTAASTYCDIEFGRTNAEMAFMTGKIKISNVGEMLRFVKLFDRIQA